MECHENLIIFFEFNDNFTSFEPKFCENLNISSIQFDVFFGDYVDSGIFHEFQQKLDINEYIANEHLYDAQLGSLTFILFSSFT